MLLSIYIFLKNIAPKCNLNKFDNYLLLKLHKSVTNWNKRGHIALINDRSPAIVVCVWNASMWHRSSLYNVEYVGRRLAGDSDSLGERTEKCEMQTITNIWCTMMRDIHLHMLRGYAMGLGTYWSIKNACSIIYACAVRFFFAATMGKIHTIHKSRSNM